MAEYQSSLTPLILIIGVAVEVGGGQAAALNDKAPQKRDFVVTL